MKVYVADLNENLWGENILNLTIGKIVYIKYL
jgi:hypothetical protein